ncbi:MAG TPA: hypothetical protein PK430_09440 [Muribaculum sp.]|uniref:Major fimbrial subunit protein N-terminal domain-containing protein n=1 Tax=Heminiphilus faecis TaxID=2601703 RepID=A0ABV4CWM5_9BACT|nr:hypothetical protein [Heminiphilus faecis]RLT75841.1 hypothetical protein D7V95_11635 [bacterium J10(2018)]HRF69432.1 hypothetical protein [Muribaculum sp.]
MKYGLKRHLWSCVTAAMLAAAVMPSAGCIGENADCPDVTADEGKKLTMQFTVVTRKLPAAHRDSRAVAAPDETQLGYADENYLDLASMRFILLDGEGNVMTTFMPDVVPEDGGNYVKYTVKASIAQSYFIESDGPYADFHIMVTGNEAAHSPSRFGFAPGMNLQQLCDAKTVGTFGFPLAKDDGNSGYLWEPSIENKQYIPMSGIQYFSISKDELVNSTEDRPVNLSVAADGSQDINMLRAIAKIEVIDRIGATGDGDATIQPDPADRASIDKVELNGCWSRASILPALDNWSVDGTVETQYVSTPSIPSDARYNEPLSFAVLHQGGNGQATQNSAAVVGFYYDGQATAARADGCRVYSAYVAEYAPYALDGREKAWVQVTVKMAGGHDGDENNPVYEMKLAEYNNGIATGRYVDILRNSIYRYEINSVSTETELYVRYTVCPMSEYSIDIPTFN